MTSSSPVGFSTGAVARGDVASGVTLNARLGGELVELSCLHEAELGQVEVAAAGTAHLARVSVHGPVKGRVLSEAELVARLAALDLDVVMHPDVFVDIELWQALGAHLLVENNDGRKVFGQRPVDLDAVFASVPEARFCLDVSHALHAGGSALVTELAARYGDKLAQLHAGCACGEPLGVRLGAEVPAAVATAFSTLGATTPVVLERSTPAYELDALAAQATIRAV